MKLYILRLEGNSDFVGAYSTIEKVAKAIENLSVEYENYLSPKEIAKEIKEREKNKNVYLYTDDDFTVVKTFLDVEID